MRRALVAAAVAALALTGCAASDEPSGAETPAAITESPTVEESPTAPASSTPTPEEDATEDGTALEVVIEGQRIEPNGRRVEVGAGEPITLRIRSDRAAELHVHSSPDQVIEVQQGTTTTELTIGRPGVVDVEEHDTGIVIFQLEVR